MSFPIITVGQSCFVLASAFIFYTVAGYPLLLGWLARRAGRPLRKGHLRPAVSVIVPVHNGAPFLADKLDSILTLDYPREKLQVLVISDGSTDGTASVARSYAGRGVQLLEIPRGGKPAAINAAFPHAQGEILLLTDVRQSLQPDSLGHMVNCFSDPTVGVVSGDLVIRSGSNEENNVGLYWRYERWIRKQLAQVDSMLGATGPFYCIRRELFVPVPEDSLLDDMYEPLAGAFFKGYRLIVEEAAVAYDYPTTVSTEFGRKVRTLAGNYQILWQLPALTGFRNRMLFHYFSYKISRLLLPWAVLALGVSAMVLPSPFGMAVTGALAMFAALAFVDRWVPERSPLKRVTSPAQAVGAMLLAAACAIAIFFVPPRQLWKPTNLRLRAAGRG